MTRRRRPLNDPVGNRVFDDGRAVVNTVLSTISPREAGVLIMRVGLEDGTPRTLDEIGQTYGVTRARVRQILAIAMSRLLHPSRSQMLRDRDEYGKAIGLIDIAPTHRTTWEDRRIIERWFENLIWCATCGERDFASRSDQGGRPRKYCSNKCRQAAYRARRASADPQ